jgi:L-threonylcarbamoyladenylate synthase
LEKINQDSGHLKINEGNLLLAPTVAGWSLLCHARNSEALKTMRSLKNRGAERGFTILVESDARLNRLVSEVPSIAWDILDTSDGDLILILPEGRNVDKEALAADGSIAIRMVKDPAERKLVQMVNGPVASTALLDISGAPVSEPQEAEDSLLEEVDYLLNLSILSKFKDKKQIPIVKLNLDGEVKIIRP